LKLEIVAFTHLQNGSVDFTQGEHALPAHNKENVESDFKRRTSMSPLFFLALVARTSALWSWSLVAAERGCIARHENGAALVNNGTLMLIGGRGHRAAQGFAFDSGEWAALPNPPLAELNHFQAVSWRADVFVVAAFTGAFPHEVPVRDVFIYRTRLNAWETSPHPMPLARRRGAAGVAVWRDALFVACGIVDGHFSGHVAWLDRFDLLTGEWRSLPDAPHARDHFQAAVVGNKLVLAGGRLTAQRDGNVFNRTIGAVDIFDLQLEHWSTLPAMLPVPRAGAATFAFQGFVVVAGGESHEMLAHRDCDALDMTMLRWRKCAPLSQGRHGSQAVVSADGAKACIAAGSARRGGGPERDTIDCLFSS
jgi:hypothetical protein